MTDTSRKQHPEAMEAILARFHTEFSDSATREYLRYHARRYAYLMNSIDKLPRGRILDIGPSFQTMLMRAVYPDSIVDTLGFHDERFPPRSIDTHINFDLNDSTSPDRWPAATGPYDLVVMAEVLEHVYTAARPVLSFVASLLRPGGNLVIQTPNAVNLMRRYSTVRGTNPYSMIREERTNPGHFCEFTARELEESANSAGFETAQLEIENYFGPAGIRKSIYNTLCAVLPGELRDGITLVARKP
jgi:predicted SAM-dependent methyltransferase